MNIIEHPRLYRLLAQINEVEQDHWGDVESDIWSLFGHECAVLISDMSHFSKVTQQHGIVYYLGLIKRMQDVVSLATVRHRGLVIKFVADNAFCIFDSVDSAVECVKDIQTGIAKENKRTPHLFDIELAYGIDFGRILNINNKDIFGDAVNIASKLGEDSAEAGQLLITERALSTTTVSKSDLTPFELKLSGLNMLCYNLNFN